MWSKEKILKTLHEIKEEADTIKPYVIICQPRRDLNEIPAQNFNGYEGLHIDLLGYSHAFCDIGGESVDVARNYLIERAIESDAKYLLFVGEDTVLPHNGFLKLHEIAEKNLDAIVVGVYYIKLSSPMIMVKKDNYIVPANVDPGQVYEAWQTGLDAALIPINILKKMKENEPELPFTCIANNIEGIPFIGEDNFFVYRLRKMGYKLLVNTDVQCLHIDLATGKYTAHPDIKLENYATNIPITVPLIWKDKKYIDQRWINRLPKSNSLKEIIEKLKLENKEIKLNLGSGGEKLQEYINIDKNDPAADIKMDAFDINLPEESIDEILASHFIEHINPYKVNILLFSLFKILKYESKLILELPDLEKLCKAFIDAKDKDRNMLTLCIYGATDTSNIPQGSLVSPHLWGYYPENLKQILISTGFKEVLIKEEKIPHPGGFNFRIEAIKRK